MINLVEYLADENDMEQSPCKWGNIVVGHSCYCHHKDRPRKCPQWRNGEPYEQCEYYVPAEKEEER